jgi:PHD/YefM family antitoxin component YafN of YafNO toxin-antitoxin module
MKINSPMSPRAVDNGPKTVHFWTMKVINVSTAKSKLGRVIDQVIKTQEPVVIPRGENHVMIAPYHLPTPDEMELARIGEEMDKSGVSVEENEESRLIIQEAIHKYRAEKRRRT